MFRIQTPLLGGCLLIAALAAFSASASAATLSVTTGAPGSGLYGITSDLSTATPAQATFGDDAENLAQTFRLLTGISLESFAILYEYDSNSAAPAPNTLPITIEIFEVADTLAATLTPGASLLNFTVPAGNFPDNGEEGEALFTLDMPIALAASTGTEGYGIRLSGGTDGSNRGFEWSRTAGAANDSYDMGEGYDNDGEVFGTGGAARELSLALNPVSVPEPSSILLGVLGMSVFLATGRGITRE